MVDKIDISQPKAETIKNKGIWRKLCWYLAAVIVAILIFYSIKLIWFSKPKTPINATSAVAYNDIEKTIIATGALVPYLEVNVGSRASVIVTNLNVAIGDLVQNLRNEIAAANRAESLYAIRYKNGAIALRIWLNSQESARATQLAYDNVRLEQLINQSKIYQALGGGTKPSLVD